MIEDVTDIDFEDIVSKAALGREFGHGSFSRFKGKPRYSLAEYFIKKFLEINHIEYVHNWHFRSDVLKFIEFDFYFPRIGAACEIDPEFHTDLGHPVTRRVYENDRKKDIWARNHGIELVRIVVYDNQNRFYNEVNLKLGGLLTRHGIPVRLLK